MTDASTHRCETCPMRKKAEANPRSLLAILWRLHTKICPGWRSYQRALAQTGATSGKS